MADAIMALSSNDVAMPSSYVAALLEARQQKNDGALEHRKHLEESEVMKKSFHPSLWTILSLAALQSFSAPSHAGNPSGPSVEPVNGPHATLSYSEEELEKQVPAAQAADVASPEAIIRAFHDAVSGPKGAWNADRLRSLCIPNVHLEYADKRDNGEVRISTITLDQLVKDLSGLHESTAWYEHVLNVHVTEIPRPESNAKIAVGVYTTAERTHPLGNYKGPGSTSTTTLLYVKNRWWVVSHVW